MSEQSLFALDLNRCTGCSACAIACRTENDVGSDVDWRQIHTFNEPRLPGIPVFHFSLACNHCAEPACLYGCPAGAYTKDERTGTVVLDGDRCIGCGYCAWVCPYDAPQFNRSTGVMEKCTFCSHRVARGDEPACVDACPVDALHFVPRGKPGPVDHPGLPETGLRPGLRLRTRRSTAATVEPAGGHDDGGSAAPHRLPSRLRSEWSLLLFTLVAAWLVAWFTTRGQDATAFHPLGFVALGAVALGVSLLHLGRPERAWRALANLRSSWISREILLFSLFLLTAGITSLLAPDVSRWDGVVLGIGLGALFSMDMVYRVRGQPVLTVPHSAMVSLTALLFIGLLHHDAWIAAPLAMIKLALYLSRLGHHPTRLPWLSALRLVAGFVWPVLVLWTAREPSTALVLAGPLLGEVIDRVQFYDELDFPGPRQQIAADLVVAAAAVEAVAEHEYARSMKER